ncbi:MAG TPA: GNAT family N-acetyltransferase [Edaphobacter sp.]|nr:GNAT family N-acetyltransferase [Edaphobacter sp.]
MNNSAASLQVRPIAPQDAQDAAELSRQLGYDTTPEAIAAHIAWLDAHPQQQAAFVACYGDEVVGWVEVAIMRNIQSPPYGFIKGFVVSENHRSLGIGKRLCREIEEWCRKRGIHHLRVGSRSSREAAHRFYLREGFQQIKTWAIFEKALSKHHC